MSHEKMIRSPITRSVQEKPQVVTSLSRVIRNEDFDTFNNRIVPGKDEKGRKISDSFPDAFGLKSDIIVAELISKAGTGQPTVNYRGDRFYVWFESNHILLKAALECKWRCSAPEVKIIIKLHSGSVNIYPIVGLFDRTSKMQQDNAVNAIRKHFYKFQTKTVIEARAEEVIDNKSVISTCTIDSMGEFPIINLPFIGRDDEEEMRCDGGRYPEDDEPPVYQGGLISNFFRKFGM